MTLLAGVGVIQSNYITIIRLYTKLLTFDLDGLTLASWLITAEPTSLSPSVLVFTGVVKVSIA